MSCVKKIGFIDSSSQMGGSHYSTLDIITHINLLESDYEPLYICQSNSPVYKYIRENNLPIKVFKLGDKFFPGWRPFNKSFAWLSKYVWMVYVFLRKNDVRIIHATNETLLWWIIPCLFTRTRLIWNVRSLRAPGFKGWLRKRIYLFFCKNVIFVSKGCKNSFEPINIKKNLEIIPNFVPIKLISLSNNFKKESSHKIRISFVGRMDDPIKDVNKAVSICAKIFSKYPSKLEFNFWGKISDANKNIIYSQIGGDMGKYFIFMGESCELPDIFKTTDILLLTSKQEGFPRVIMEAGSLGVPAVAHNVGGTSEIICHGETGYLFNSDLEAVQYLEELIVDINKISKIGNHAKKFFLESYPWKVIVSKYLNYYSTL
jgi:glycosyltransferase involved in cell wall biosynthesis